MTEAEARLTEARATYLGKLVRGTSENSRFPKIGIVQEVKAYGSHYGHPDSPDADEIIIRIKDHTYMWLNKNWTWEVYR